MIWLIILVQITALLIIEIIVDRSNKKRGTETDMDHNDKHLGCAAQVNNAIERAQAAGRNYHNNGGGNF
jgi:hypothetical protein